jgi:hypothetical protein
VGVRHCFCVGSLGPSNLDQDSAHEGIWPNESVAFKPCL